MEDATPAEGTERPAGTSEATGEPIGPFPTWRALYITVLVYAILTVGVLYALTVLLDRSTS